MKLTQQNKILKLLRENTSINSHDLTYIYGIKQAPTRIKELRVQGYEILSSFALENKSVNYSLIDFHKERKVVRYEFDNASNTAIPIYEN